MASYFLISGWIILFFTTFITFSRGEGVSLSVEGEVSLVGPHCPNETVTLFCEAVDLSSLRWRYNGNINIKTYFPTGISSSQPAQLEFFMVQLLTDQQNPNDANLANFSSNLTVQFSQLDINNVTDISCGAPGVSQAVLVNVSTIEPDVPNNPNITMVTAEYQSGELNSVEVTWEKLEDFCPSFGSSFTYQVNITMYDPVLVNNNSYDDASCVISFKNLTGETREYTVAIKAENELGSSGIVVYPYSIGYQIQQHFTPEVLTKDGQLFGRCTTAPGFTDSDECIVQYTTDSMYRDLSDETIGPLNEDFSLLENLVPETTYYFLFRALVNNTLQITDRVVFKYSVQEGVPGYGVALIVIAVIVFIIVLVIVLLIATFFILVKKQTSKKQDEIEKNSPVELTQVSKESRELTVSVEGHEIEKKVTGSGVFKKTNHFTVYKIVSKYGDRTSTVQKLDEQFAEMHREVRESPTYGSEAEKIELPPDKELRENLFRPEKFDKEHFDSRKTELDKFISNLLKIPKILECPVIQKFLGLNEDFLKELKENGITELQGILEAPSAHAKEALIPQLPMHKHADSHDPRVSCDSEFIIIKEPKENGITELEPQQKSDHETVSNEMKSSQSKDSMQLNEGEKVSNPDPPSASPTHSDTHSEKSSCMNEADQQN